MIDPISTVAFAGYLGLRQPDTQLRSLTEIEDVPLERPLSRLPTALDSGALLASGDISPAPSLPVLAATAGTIEGRYEKLFRKLEDFATGSLIDSNRSASDAIRFLESVPAGVPLPLAVQGELGTITLVWKSENFYADIEFEGDGSYAIFAREYTPQKIDHDLMGIELGDTLDAHVANILSRLAPAALQADLAA